MNAEFIRALDVIQEEKSIDKEELIQAIEAAITTAYKKNYGNAHNVEINIDREKGDIQVFALKEIVEFPENDHSQISLEKAREFDSNYQVGDFFRKEVRPRDFGRIAAQNAKQLIIQRIKEAERNIIYNDYLERQDEVLTGIIKRIEKGIVYVEVGKLEAVMLPSEQTTGENYQLNQRLKVYLLMVKKTTKGPQVNVSRTHPGLVKRLFESEVPEIFDGIVDIVSISREAGSRTKVAVKANEPSIDPVGACVGQKGVRVQNIINELQGEKIDVIKWSDNVEEYLANALSPAKVVEIIPNKDDKTAIAIVDDYQLSLAIGKEGQNVRLAAKLTGWKIDIKSKIDYVNQHQIKNQETSANQDDILLELKEELELADESIFEDECLHDDELNFEN
ncbi:transcription termination factor NusA [Acetobacterium woodii]|uniref:Transcription termination/antitermination protein NusA n=1 Tax=Acetobacterium woodii (strain ATCC 29683 / DSM 1030 / JCM 2381 / KCTC 1655 / WB1) TaxID=931626 RepID=H6LJW9_ACEWD|nr:transcription termination factor NusA [Acetobacterium woodii]AFA48723.1 transcription elongation protein NusA [Acetobacterium woodii DSM 1030]